MLKWRPDPTKKTGRNLKSHMSKKKIDYYEK